MASFCNREDPFYNEKTIYVSYMLLMLLNVNYLKEILIDAWRHLYMVLDCFIKEVSKR